MNTDCSIQKATLLSLLTSFIRTYTRYCHFSIWHVCTDRVNDL